jgi:hypothetical protein
MPIPRDFHEKASNVNYNRENEYEPAELAGQHGFNNTDLVKNDESNL